MNFIVTKTLLDLNETMRILARQKHEALSFPLLKVLSLDDPNWPKINQAKRPYQAILFTSRYAIIGLKRFIQGKHHYFYDIPAYAVGGKTASFAIDSGFKKVVTAGGNAHDMAYLLSEKLTDITQPILYVSGKDTSFDFETFFTMAGFPFDRLVVYKSEGTNRMPINILNKFLEGWVEGILFYSSKGADVFIELAHKHELDLSKITAFCLSKQIGEKLEKLPFNRRCVAVTPTEEALLSLLKPLHTSSNADTLA